jgi:hypothetical protein
MRYFWIVVLVLAALAGAWFWWDSEPSNGNEAVLAMMDDGELNFTATPVSPTEVRITVLRLAGSDDEVHFVIPAGTIVYPPGEGAQRMVIAASVPVDLGVDEVGRDFLVEAYCLDQFLDPPAEGSILLFSEPGWAPGATGWRSVTDSDIDVTALTSCLEKQGGSHNQRQHALWLVIGDLLDLTPDAAEDQMAGRYAERLPAQAERAVRGTIRAQIMAQMPHASTQLIDRALEEFIAERAGPLVAAEARRMAQRDLTGMRTPQVRAMLDNCEVDTQGKALFG